jgi:anti-sigma factor RsiW
MNEHDKAAHEKYADDLPLLALGALEGAEREAVEAHVRSCDVCSRELQRLNSDVAMLALSTPLERPPERAKTRLIKALEHEPKRIAIRAPRSRWSMLVPTAVALGLAVLVGALGYQNHALRADLAALDRMAREDRVTAARAVAAMRMLTGQDPETVRVTLVSTNAKPQPTGRAVYSPRSGGLVLLASNFAPLPADKAYELWLIPQQGAPIPAGVFKPDAQGSAMMVGHQMPKNMQPKAFAVTIERAEGASTPTMPIMMMGQG